MTDCPTITRAPKEPDSQAVRDAVAAAVDAFCESYSLAGRQHRTEVWNRFPAETAAIAESLAVQRG